MVEKSHLWPEEVVAEDGWLRLSASLEQPGWERRQLWYRLPEAQRPALRESCDPFLLGFLFNALRSPHDLLVHGQVSPSLLRNLAELQTVWASWKPARYHRIEIGAEVERELPPAEGDEAVMGFSGGADSAYTAWRHRSGQAGRQSRNLVAGVMLHGFDIPLDQPDMFERARANAEAMLASLGMELIPVVTNFRGVGGTWDDAFGAGLASALMLLQGRFRTGLIASGRDYSTISFPLGSTPMTDPMMSSDSFRIVHDGTEAGRLEKLKALCAWPEALQRLRVCWQGEHKDRNCCRCPKCVRTILTFRILGQGLPACFEHDLSDGQILRLRLGTLTELQLMEPVLGQARAAGIRDPWVRALAVSIRLSRLRLAVSSAIPFRPALRSVYRLFLPPLE